MQKSLSIIISNTKKSELYFKQLKKYKFFIDDIIFYSKENNHRFLKELKKYPYKNTLKIIKTNSVNAKSISCEVVGIKSNYILYSGYEAEILKNDSILKKNIIHCHPGLLPKYRGSTILYYSLILNYQIHVSIFKITKNIDDGKVLFTKKFDIPKKMRDIEKNFDNLIRSKTLIFFLKSKKIKKKTQYSKFLNFYYIAHPIIRTIISNPKAIKSYISL
jgi:methionyl-tRNA formyltransferase